MGLEPPWSVSSRPSRIQVMPSAMTTSQCHRLHGSRSMRAGTSVRTASVLAAGFRLVAELLMPHELLPCLIAELVSQQCHLAFTLTRSLVRSPAPRATATSLPAATTHFS
jgi:hypothetical protein